MYMLKPMFTTMLLHLRDNLGSRLGAEVCAKAPFTMATEVDPITFGPTLNKRQKILLRLDAAEKLRWATRI
jgi:hypothetical protein